MYQQSMRPLHAVDDPPHRIRRLDRQRLGIAARRHERKHHHVGVAIEKHVFDKFLGSKTVEITTGTRLGGETAARFGRPLECICGRCLHPRPGRVDEVPLHVKNKFTLAADPRLRELRFKRRVRFDVEESIELSHRRVGYVECEQCTRRAARRNQKVASAHA